jgi:PLP dependent protein
MTISTTTLQQRIATVRQQLDDAAARVGREPASITITAVSKTVDRQKMIKAYDLGLRHFGENRVQDARTKLADPMPDDAILHLVGQLQTNKANHAVQFFQIIESVDRLSLIQELEKQASRRDHELPVLLQVNVAGEEQKAGCAVDDANELARQIMHAEHLRLDGLMTMAPLVDDAEDVRFVFRGLRELRDRLSHELSTALPILSMGMTNDFPVAIEEGATHIRVGRAIFG